MGVREVRGGGERSEPSEAAEDRGRRPSPERTDPEPAAGGGTRPDRPGSRELLREGLPVEGLDGGARELVMDARVAARAVRTSHAFATKDVFQSSFVARQAHHTRE